MSSSTTKSSNPRPKKKQKKKGESEGLLFKAIGEKHAKAIEAINKKFDQELKELETRRKIALEEQSKLNQEELGGICKRKDLSICERCSAYASNIILCDVCKDTFSCELCCDATSVELEKCGACSNNMCDGCSEWNYKYEEYHCSSCAKVGNYNEFDENGCCY
jgi:hypothetical protein